MNPSYTERERRNLKIKIATECIFGVDVARDPALARIARMNMYLHGDGGASIYQADALDKDAIESPTDTPELKKEIAQLRELIGSGDFADVAITNPPFAKEYQRKYPREQRILEGYLSAVDSEGGRNKNRPSLRSSIMFLERYHDILKPGGRLITVIDDSILGGTKHKSVRDFIRRKFVVRGVVSLPGDAFQRSKARVKTSLIILQKKHHPDEEQPPVFMTYCTAVGLDDPSRQRILPVDAENRKRALAEIETVVQLYDDYWNGKPSAREWTVPPDRIQDRMDVKNCLLDPFRNVEKWRSQKMEVSRFGRWIEVTFPSNGVIASENSVESADIDGPLQLLRVRYDGFAEPGELIQPAESGYSLFYRVVMGDIVISNINAVHGAIAIVPESLHGTYVTPEFTVCRAKGIDPMLVWALLRSPEARANLLLLATGIGRNRVKSGATESLKLPVPDSELSIQVVDTLTKANELERQAIKLRREAIETLESNLKLNSDEAHAILAAFKPPR